MNVYDFDGTIYAGDSSLEFWLYCLRKRPGLLRYFPLQLYGVARYRLGLCSKTRMKECFFYFVRGLPDTSEFVEKFWHTHQRGIMAWYLAQRKEDDVVISASPEFLLRPLCDAMGIRHLIASRVSPQSGSFDGENCYGGEKPRRFLEVFPDASVQAFYSDSRTDEPMVRLAAVAYLCKGEKLHVWKNGK